MSPRRSGRYGAGDQRWSTGGHDAEIMLNDGRVLRYRHWGRAEGSAVLLFHGAPGSRLFCPDLHATEAAGVQLITIDRPGYGGSDRHVGRALLDWPADVEQVGDHLALEDFAVVGFSMGSVYALACAAAMPARLHAAAIAGGACGPLEQDPHAYDDDDRALAELLLRDPERARSTAETAPWILERVRDPEGLLNEDTTPEPDMWVLRERSPRTALEGALREAMVQGPYGLADDWIASVSPWGFDLADIPIEVSLWHGEHDHLESRRSVDLVAEGIPRCRVVSWPDAGHLGLMKHWDEVLATVTS